MADLLMFRIGRELFATELRAVDEAIDLTTAEQITNVPAPLRSVLTLRGSLVPLFSPAHVLGVTPAEAATALIVRDDAGRLAILADDVEDVINVHDGELRPVPASAHDNGVVRGLVRRGSSLIAVVDLPALIAACRGAEQQGAA